jgi:hypothetical protein
MVINRQDIPEIAKEIYAFGVNPTTIPAETSLSLGKLLVDANYRVVGNYLVRNPVNRMTVRDMLAEMDHDLLAQPSGDPGDRRPYVNRFVGPVYSNLDDQVSLLPGIAVWEPITEVSTTEVTTDSGATFDTMLPPAA